MRGNIGSAKIKIDAATKTTMAVKAILNETAPKTEPCKYRFLGVASFSKAYAITNVGKPACQKKWM
jgi:hypothetical protein